MYSGLVGLLAACAETRDDGTTKDSDGASSLPDIVINEFLADNTSYADPDGDPVDSADPGEFDDWVELFNAGDTLVQLEGLYLTDDFAEPTKWAMPTGQGIGPGEFLVVWCDGEPEQGDLHTSFQLEKNGEEIGLYYAADGEGAWVNKVQYGNTATDRSNARVPDGARNWETGVAPTPGDSNGG
ncbi:MAG: lamin tail domain-containing protein [Myxococcota bacterium]